MASKLDKARRDRSRKFEAQHPQRKNKKAKAKR
jgi:hypothetical protein